MPLVQCANGHYYNNEESATCPYCSGGSSAGKTIPLGGVGAPNPVVFPANPEPMGSTVPLGDVNTIPVGGPEIPATSPVEDPLYGKTKFMDQDMNSDVKPVRGWLVVVEGEKLGYDFRIHTGSNPVGRSSHNAICFDFDQTISQENCCDIVYDDRAKQFFIRKGNGTNNIYVNNKILLDPKELHEFDIVEIGQTKLTFRSLCGPEFDYNNCNKNEA